jgi:hypothetical protein
MFDRIVQFSSGVSNIYGPVCQCELHVQDKVEFVKSERADKYFCDE